MKKGPILIIALSLVTILLLISFGSIKTTGVYESVLIEFNNKEKVLYMTPDGDTDVVPIPNALMAIGAKIESLQVGEEILTKDMIIYINEDGAKDIFMKIKNMWGVKEYKVVLILSNHVKFHIDGELVKIVNKDDVAKEVGFPVGNYEWFVDEALTRPFDIDNLNDVLSVYAVS